MFVPGCLDSPIPAEVEGEARRSSMIVSLGAIAYVGLSIWLIIKGRFEKLAGKISCQQHVMETTNLREEVLLIWPVFLRVTVGRRNSRKIRRGVFLLLCFDVCPLVFVLHQRLALSFGRHGSRWYVVVLIELPVSRERVNR
jgi:hypothetical protein